MKTKKKIVRDVSLARALSKLGFCSRAEGAKIIAGSRVTVNGVVVANASFRVAIDADVIEVDGARPRVKKSIYIMMNKPPGVVTTRSDERGRSTVYDLLDDVGGWIFPVGRLDKDTSGLLLLTNDNRLGERLTNPDSKVPKLYELTLGVPITEEQCKRLAGGLSVDGERYAPAKVRRLSATGFPTGITTRITIEISEGKNRQVRRMCSAVGCDVVTLRRIRIGNLELGNLQQGKWRHLSKEEVLNLQHSS